MYIYCADEVSVQYMYDKICTDTVHMFPNVSYVGNLYRSWGSCLVSTIETGWALVTVIVGQRKFSELTALPARAGRSSSQLSRGRTVTAGWHPGRQSEGRATGTE